MVDKNAILDELIRATSLPLREPEDIDAHEYAERLGVTVDLARKWLKAGAEELGFRELTVYDVEKKRRVNVWRKVDA